MVLDNQKFGLLYYGAVICVQVVTPVPDALKNNSLESPLRCVHRLPGVAVTTVFGLCLHSNQAAPPPPRFPAMIGAVLAGATHTLLDPEASIPWRRGLRSLMPLPGSPLPLSSVRSTAVVTCPPQAKPRMITLLISNPLASSILSLAALSSIAAFSNPLGLLIETFSRTTLEMFFLVLCTINAVLLCGIGLKTRILVPDKCTLAVELIRTTAASLYIANVPPNMVIWPGAPRPA